MLARRRSLAGVLTTALLLAGCNPADDAAPSSGEEALPGEALPGEALPEEALPEEALPEEAAPEDAAPGPEASSEPDDAAGLAPSVGERGGGVAAEPDPRRPIDPGGAPPPPPDSRAEVIGEAEALVGGLLDQPTDGRYAVLAVDEHGREIVAHEPDTPILPASTLKIVTAAAALTTFGPDARFSTRVETSRPLVEGTLDGDLWLLGGGDPVLGTEEYETFVSPSRPRTPLEELADDVAASGLTRVEGDLVGVADGYEGPAIAEGWPDRYFSSLDARYADGLTLDAGLRTLPTYAEPAEDAAEEADEDGEDGEDDDEAADDDQAEDEEAADEDDEAEGEEEREIVAVEVEHAEEPAEHATETLLRLLEERDIEVTGGARVGELDERLVGRLGRVQSPPLEELLRFAVQRSDNQVADAIFQAVGRARTGTGSFASGDRGLRQALDHLGVDHEGARFADGSGLSREDRATARLLVDVDRAMQRSRHAATWTSLMAVTGESGTLQGRLRSGIAAGRFAGKTGTLRDVNGLVGTVHGTSGRRYHLAVVAHDAGEGRWLAHAFADELIVLLAADLDGCEAAAGETGAGPLGRPALAVVC